MMQRITKEHTTLLPELRSSGLQAPLYGAPVLQPS